MADYYPSISRAVAALDKKSFETRRVVYDRARTTLADQLQRVDPLLSETDLKHERLALEHAISKVEADAMLLSAYYPHHASEERASLGPVRRTINLICALGLTGVGAYYFFDLLFYHPPSHRFKLYGVVIAGAATAAFLGLYWLWIDFIKPDPRPEK
jgi:hypothetical protein